MVDPKAIAIAYDNLACRKRIGSVNRDAGTIADMNRSVPQLNFQPADHTARTPLKSVM
jgi:hypothetical protein